MTLLALRNLVSEKTRFLFSAAGIGFAVFLITILLGLYQGWNEKVGGFVEKIEGDAWVARQGTTDFINAASILPLDHAEELAATDAVEGVYPLIVRPMVFYNGGGPPGSDGDTGKETVTQLIGYDAENGVGGPLKIVKGKAVPEGNEIVIDEVLARTRGVDIGDHLRSGGTEVEVVGFASGGNFVLTQASFMDIEAARALLNMDGLTTFFVVDLREGADFEAWTQDVATIDPNVVVYTNDEFASKTRHRILDNVTPILLLIVALALVVGVAVTSLTIYTTTVEKTREFGVMKAIGFNNVDLYKLVLSQSIVIGFLGFAFGVLLTLILSRFVDRIVPQFIVSVRPIDIVFVLGATLMMAALAAVVPARRVGGVDPAVVFRG